MDVRGAEGKGGAEEEGFWEGSGEDALLVTPLSCIYCVHGRNRHCY
jgi:hypothetical protein